MKTATKLWLGFGTLIALLVLSSLATILRIDSIDAQLQQMKQARNLSAASSELEVAVLSHALAVRTYLQTGDEQALRDMANSVAAVEYQLKLYEDLATNRRQREIAKRFDASWQELEMLGQAMLEPETGLLKLEHSRKFYEVREATLRLLNEQMQTDAARAYDAREEMALRDTGSVARFALYLLIAGTLIAALTSALVARGVIRAENRLWASREQLRVTLASIGDGVITADVDGKISYLNPVAEQLTGWTLAAATGRSLRSTFQIVNEQTRLEVDNPGIKALREGSVVGLTNHTLLISRDGSERPIDDSAAPIRDEQGQVTGAVLIFRDVSERRDLERVLRRNASDLAEAERRKDEFLAMLAHELRNPLAPISNALQIMRRSPDPTQFASATEMIERQVQQMVRLVDDLLDISRISRGKIELRRSIVDLTAIIRHAAESARPQCLSRSHDLQVSLPEQPVYLDADPMRLTQVIGNLLNNACKFTDRGGRIELWLELEDEQLAIHVRDNGIGIAAEQLGHIFDPFIHAHTAPGRNTSGIGIGLSLVQNLVKLHGGSVLVSSAGLGQGSEFVLRLPRPDPALIPPKPAAEEPARPLPPRRILVVDDNRDAATSIAALLMLDGHEIRMVWDGETALSLAAQWQPEIVLLDIGLPGLNGYEVAQQIRRQDWGQKMLLIAITGWGQHRDRQKTAQAGFDGHLVKPASYERIVQLLSSELPTSA